MPIKLALCRTDSPFFDLENGEMQALFSPERLKAVKKRPQSAQRSTAAGQWLLMHLLQEAAPALTPPFRFDYGWQDKPMLADAPHVYFNLSHSGDWAVCAVAPVEVGVDVQEVRRVSPALVRKFSEKERKWLGELAQEEFTEKFTELWCLKEAYCKCVGDGLRIPLSATSFTLEPLTIDKAGFQVLLPHAPDEKHRLALCVRTEEPISVNIQTFDIPKGDYHDQ